MGGQHTRGGLSTARQLTLWTSGFLSLTFFFLRGGGGSSSAEEEKSCKMSGFLCVLRRFIFLFTPCSSSFVSAQNFCSDKDSVVAWLSGRDLLERVITCH